MKCLVKIIQQRILSWLRRILRHRETPGGEIEGKMLGKRGGGGERITFSKQELFADNEASMR